MLKFSKTILQTTLGAALAIASTISHAQNMIDYEVTIMNISAGQSFTPQLVVAHKRGVQLYELGSPASRELEMLAEGGDTAPLTMALEAMGDSVADVKTNGVLLAPGETTTVMLSSKPSYRLSLAAMMLPSNDNFIALNGVLLPFRRSSTHFLPAYDAGTEANDQNCLNIPGPHCGGAGHSPGPNEGDEGFVHIGNGFHDLGTSDEAGNQILSPAMYDWRNSVAKVTIKRMR